MIVWSPSGPLTRSELELVEGVGDPLTLAGLLPDRPVAIGQTWSVGRASALGLSGYDALAANSLQATLESLDPAAQSGVDPAQGRGSGRRAGG